MKYMQTKIVEYLMGRGYKASDIIFDKGLPAGLDKNYFRLTDEWEPLDFEYWRDIRLELEIPIEEVFIDTDDDEDRCLYILDEIY